MPFAKLPQRPQQAAPTDNWQEQKKYIAFAGPFHLQRAITTKRPTLIAAIKSTKI